MNKAHKIEITYWTESSAGQTTQKDPLLEKAIEELLTKLGYSYWWRGVIGSKINEKIYIQFAKQE